MSLIAYEYNIYEGGEVGQCDSWCEFEYSTDGMKTWNDYLINSTDDKDKIIQLDNCENKTVYFQAKYGDTEDNPNRNGLADYTYNEAYDYYSLNKYHRFVMEGSIKASGNIQFLLDNTGSRTDVPMLCYNNMFKGCTSLTQTPELPATTLAYACYRHMFFNCSALTQAPELPATTLAVGCYEEMFANCTSLTQAPELPATTLAERCYYNMFSGCSSLTQAPELPATTLADLCYGSMFSGCSSLTQAPELPATTLAERCYYNMFWRCTALTQASFPNLEKETVATEVVESQDTFYDAATDIETTCKDGILIINSTKA